MMMGVDLVLISALRQSRFSPSGDQRATSPFSLEMPFISGPRQCGQSSGSFDGVPANALTAEQSVMTRRAGSSLGEVGLIATLGVQRESADWRLSRLAGHMLAGAVAKKESRRHVG
jgi:hypothetical protein